MRSQIAVGTSDVGRVFRLAVMALACVVILAACGNEGEEDGRIFTTDPVPTALPTDPPPTQTIIEEPTSDVAEVPTADVFEIRGAPRVIYLENQGKLTAYDTTERAFTEISIPEGYQLQDYAASPTGDRVGVLLSHDNTVGVQFFGADGELLGSEIPLNIPAMPGNTASPVSSPVASPAANPVAAPSWSIVQVSWIPQGNGLLVSGPAGLLQVSMNGRVMPITRTGVNGTVTDAVWSPMDSQVAIQAQMPDGTDAVYLLKTGDNIAEELSAFHNRDGAAITNLQWLPNGRGTVLVVGERTAMGVMNGQLYVYRFDEATPMLIATSAQGGPAATISHIAVSPDGLNVAYSVSVLDGDTWRLHSLWLRPTRGGPAMQVPLNRNAELSSLQWSAEGLVWQFEDGAAMVFDGDTPPRVLGEAPIPPATPMATPVSSPQATPEPTPNLTPAG